MELVLGALPFVNLYYVVPVTLAGYFLARRRAAAGILFGAVMIAVSVMLLPEDFQVWGGLLMLGGTVVGRLQEKLAAEVRATSALNVELRAREQELTAANQRLQAYGETLEATMDPSVVNLIIEGQLRTEKRKLAVMFSDLSGFTTYSEDRAPELVIRDVNRCLADMEPVILAYRGHIDKYMGDGTMSEFGAPLVSDTYRLQAVLAAVKLQERVSAGHYPWKMRIGIASGVAITGLVGSRRQTYTALGDVVNLASRLERLAVPGRILIDRYTYEDVARFVEAEKKRDLPVREVRDAERERQLDRLHEQMTGGATDADRFYQIGRLHQELNEPVEALQYFERALALDTNHAPFREACAEARLRLDSGGALSIKGKRKRVEAYEVVGLKDPLADRDKLTDEFCRGYRDCVARIGIPADVVLPVEALDGRVGHATVVAVLAYALADVLGVHDAERVDVMRAGFLADIGMEIVPPQVLNRRGALAATELETISKHPLASARVARTMGYDNESVLAIIRSSHELLDGSGYPERRRGDAIPLGARIVTVADAYDALTAGRPYREAVPRAAALEELGRGVVRGVYDARVVQALAKLLG